MSQQPYQPGPPGQPSQPGQPGGYQQPGYPAGGYPQPGQPPAPGYGRYQGSGGQQPFGSPSPGAPSSRASGNPMDSPATLAPIIQIVGYVVAVLGVIGGFFAFGIDGYPGSFKFVTFAATAVAGLGFGGVLVALAALLKTRPTGDR